MITRKTRRGIIAMVILTVVSFWGSRDPIDDDPTPVADLDPKFNYVLRDFDMQFFDEQGQPSLSIHAPLFRNDPDMELGTIEKPVVKLHQPDAVWDLTADTATLTADKEHIQLIGRVNIQRQELVNGTWSELITEDVNVEVTPQTATTAKSVQVFDGDNHVSGIGLDLYMKTNEFLLKEQVRATYAIN